MKNLKIFCEGVTDQVFIADCLELLYKVNIRRKPKKNDNKKFNMTFDSGCEIVEVGGCSMLTNDLFIQAMKETEELNGTNIIIFDADFPSDVEGKGTGNRGFKSCVQKLEDIKKNHSVKFEYLIWPNHSKDGEIEDLLRQLIPKEREPILDCICTHQDCLKSLELLNLRIAEPKEIIGYYLHTSFQESNVSRRDYKDSVFWNLDFESIDDLNKLRQFLDLYFVQKE
jgi:hypothetical protein